MTTRSASNRTTPPSYSSPHLDLFCELGTVKMAPVTDMLRDSGRLLSSLSPSNFRHPLYADDIEKLWNWIVQDVFYNQANARAFTSDTAFQGLLGKAAVMALQQLPDECSGRTTTIDHAVDSIPAKTGRLPTFNIRPITTLLMSYIIPWGNLVQLEFNSMELRNKMAKHFNKAGLMPAVAAAAEALSDALAKPHVPDSALDSMLRAAQAILVPMTRLTMIWPGDVLPITSSISQTVKPLSKLALATVRLCSRTSSPDGQCSHLTCHTTQLGSSNDATDPASAIGYMSLIVDKMCSEASVSPAGAQQHLAPERSTALAATLVNIEMLQVLLLHVACIGKVLHKHAKGVSAASVADLLKPRGFESRSAGQLKVPAYHKDVFEGLGLSRQFDFNPVIYQKAVIAPDTVVGSAVLLYTRILECVACCAMLNPLEDTTVDDFIEAGRPLLPLWLLLLIELHMLLSSQPVGGLIVVSIAERMLGLYEGRDSSPTFNNVCKTVAQPVVQLLGPSVLHACKGSEQEQLDISGPCLGVVLLLVCESDAGFEQVAAACKDSPIVSYAVLEAAARLKASKLPIGGRSIPDEQMLCFGMACTWLCGTNNAGSTSSTSHDCTAISTGKAVTKAEQSKDLALQQFALLMSTVKCTAAVASAQPQLRWHAVQQAAMAAAVAQHHLEAAVAGGAAEQRQRQFDAALPWLVLSARSLKTIAEVLTAEQQADCTMQLPPRLASKQQLLHSPWSLLKLSSDILVLVEQLVLQLPEHAAEQQLLLSQHGELSVLLKRMLDAEYSSTMKEALQQQTSSSSKHGWAMFRKLGRQVLGEDEGLQSLIGFCELLMTQMPLQQCCNNPFCVRTGSLTELKLAGSKNSICSGCKHARYCCRQCQAAHWKRGHKDVCKKIQETTAAAAAVQ